MSTRKAAQDAVEKLDLQLKELSGIRNATARDPSFKNWRQATLTVMQRIWPGDQDRCERFRRIPFSPADPRADVRVMREWYSRGCQEAGRVLTGFMDDIRANGVPDQAGTDLPETHATDFEDGFPTVDLPAGDLGSTASAADMTENMLAALDDSLPQGSEPGAPVPQQLQVGVPPTPPEPAQPQATLASPESRTMKKGPSMKSRLRDLLGFAHLSAKAIAGFPREAPEPAGEEQPALDPSSTLGVLPVGEDVGPSPALRPPVLHEPASPTPVWPVLQPPAAAHTSAIPRVPPVAQQPAPPPAETPVAETDPITDTPVIVTKPTTLRTSIEKVSIESLISPAFRTGAGGEAAPPAAESTSAPVPDWPSVGTPPPAEPAEASVEPTPPPPPAAPRPSRPIVQPVFDDPEFSADAAPSGKQKMPVAKTPTPPAPAAPVPALAPQAPVPPAPTAAKKPAGRASSSKIIPLPTPPARVPPPEQVVEAETSPEVEAADSPTTSSGDSEAYARATEDFMRSSPVLGATGRRVQHRLEDPGLADADAIALGSMVQDLARMRIPADRQPEVRARLLEIARRLEGGEFEWSALRKAVWFVMEYPDLARRVMPLLLPWIDRAA